MPKFEYSRLDRVSVIAKTYTHTYIHTHTYYTHTAELRYYLKTIFFAVIEKAVG